MYYAEAPRSINMSLKEEIHEFLSANIQDGPNKQRDIRLILFFYGFEGAPWPTLEDTGVEFDIGTPDNRRERPRQIIAANFRDVVTTADIPSILECAELINRLVFINVRGLHLQLQSRGLISEGASVKGVLNLLHNLGECVNFEIYTSNLQVATRSTYDTSVNLFLIRGNILPDLRRLLNLALRFPARVGVARVSDLRNVVGEAVIGFQNFITILKSNDRTWYHQTREEEFYLVEDSEDNTLINHIEKIKNVADFVELDELAVVLENGFKQRSPPAGKQYPDLLTIKEYLSRSRRTTLFGSRLSLDVEPSDLNPIEFDIINYLRGKGTTDFPTISNFLQNIGYEKDHITKSILNSPLVHKGGTRGTYTYRLIAAAEPVHGDIDEYQQFKKRLEEVGASGTDSNQDTLARKEHHILTEWLFRGKERENCAICGKVYSTEGLTTAHKKRRTDCSQNERLDPYIVMPACNFGCDYLYEKGYAWIEEGTLRTQVAETFSQTEREYIATIQGRLIEERWLIGSDSYFKKPA